MNTVSNLCSNMGQQNQEHTPACGSYGRGKRVQAWLMEPWCKIKSEVARTDTGIGDPHYYMTFL